MLVKCAPWCLFGPTPPATNMQGQSVHIRSAPGNDFMPSLRRLSIIAVQVKQKHAHLLSQICPDSKVHVANIGPTWVLWAPCWPHEPCYLGCVRHHSVGHFVSFNQIIHLGDFMNFGLQFCIFRVLDHAPSAWYHDIASVKK